MTPARVTCSLRDLSLVACAEGDLAAEVSGKFRAAARGKSDFPVVGDWVAVHTRPSDGRATIHAVLPRAAVFSRKAPGDSTGEQVIAANIDTLFIVMGMDGDYNIRRLERYLAQVWNGGGMPVVILNKLDVCDDWRELLAETQASAFGVPVHAISAEDGRGMEDILPYLGRGKTIALIGSSGVGKSTIINRLAGIGMQDTAPVRESDSRGRHTTVTRELIILASGAALIDNPGLRELGLWGDEESVDRAFEDIEELAGQCRFGDCSHGSEPGCAVRKALEDSVLDPDRYRSWLKLRRELRYLASRVEGKVRLETKVRDKRIAKFQKSLKKERG
jgi:ribosome biogenesis GTPase